MTRWAEAFHQQQIHGLPGGRCCLLHTPILIAEASVSVAVGQGWIVIGTDTEVLEQPLVNWPAQSNPRRAPNHWDGH